MAQKKIPSRQCIGCMTSRPKKELVRVVRAPRKKTVRMLFDEDIFIFAENAGKMVARSLLQQPDLHTKRILSIFTTWGISACMMVRGEILNGPDSLIGEIGHMIIDPNDHVQCLSLIHI